MGDQGYLQKQRISEKQMIGKDRKREKERKREREKKEIPNTSNEVLSTSSLNSELRGINEARGPGARPATGTGPGSRGTGRGDRSCSSVFFLVNELELKIN